VCKKGKFCDSPFTALGLTRGEIAMRFSSLSRRLLVSSGTGPRGSKISALTCGRRIRVGRLWAGVFGVLLFGDAASLLGPFANDEPITDPMAGVTRR
jgi:hypothetical protein